MTRVEQRLVELLNAAAPSSQALRFGDIARRVDQRRKLRWSILGSAVAVAAIVTMTAAVWQAGDSGNRKTPVAAYPAVDLFGAVPWTDTPAAPYQPPPLSTPPPATDARPCTAGDVAATYGIRNGAGGGHLINFVSFRNTSASTCVLKGYPHVTMTEPGLPDVVGTDGGFLGSFHGGSPANMAPGQDTLLGLETDTSCATRPGGGPAGPLYHHVDIALSGGGTISLERPSNGFDTGCGLHVISFYVSQPTPVGPHDPLTDLRVALEVPATAIAGTTLIYVADLTNPTDQPISLKACPGYLETTPAPTQIKAAYALNCAAVAAVAAKQTVRFEIRMRLPVGTPAGPLTIRWALLGPDLTSSAATVDVLAPKPTMS